MPTDVPGHETETWNPALGRKWAKAEIVCADIFGAVHSVRIAGVVVPTGPEDVESGHMLLPDVPAVGLLGQKCLVEAHPGLDGKVHVATEEIFAGDGMLGDATWTSFTVEELPVEDLVPEGLEDEFLAGGTPVANPTMGG